MTERETDGLIQHEFVPWVKAKPSDGCAYMHGVPGHWCGQPSERHIQRKEILMLGQREESKSEKPVHALICRCERCASTPAEEPSAEDMAVEKLAEEVRRFCLKHTDCSDNSAHSVYMDGLYFGDLLRIIARALQAKRRQERKRCAETVRSWGECECGSAATLHEIADEIEKG